MLYYIRHVWPLYTAIEGCFEQHGVCVCECACCYDRIRIVNTPGHLNVTVHVLFSKWVTLNSYVNIITNKGDMELSGLGTLQSKAELCLRKVQNIIYVSAQPTNQSVSQSVCSFVYLFFYLTMHSRHLFGARSRSVVRALVHGAMGRQIAPSWWAHWAISFSSQCSTTGVTKAVVCIILPVGWCI